MRKKGNDSIFFAKYQGNPLEVVPEKYPEKSKSWPGFEPGAPVVKEQPTKRTGAVSQSNGT